MSFVKGHLGATTVVGLAVIAVALVFAFARPKAGEARASSHEVDMAHEHQYALADVRRAFAGQRIALVHAYSMDGTRIFVDRHRGDSFQVTLFSPHAKVSWQEGAVDKAVYDKRLGALEVFYGGGD